MAPKVVVRLLVAPMAVPIRQWDACRLLVLAFRWVRRMEGIRLVLEWDHRMVATLLVLRKILMAAALQVLVKILMVAVLQVLHKIPMAAILQVLDKIPMVELLLLLAWTRTVVHYHARVENRMVALLPVDDHHLLPAQVPKWVDQVPHPAPEWLVAVLFQVAQLQTQ